MIKHQYNYNIYSVLGTGMEVFTDLRTNSQ